MPTRANANETSTDTLLATTARCASRTLRQQKMRWAINWSVPNAAKPPTVAPMTAAHSV